MLRGTPRRGARGRRARSTARRSGSRTAARPRAPVPAGLSARSGSAIRSAARAGDPAAEMASASIGAVSSTCQARAPSALSCARDRVDVGAGRLPHHPADGVGRQQVLHRQLVLLGELGSCPSRASVRRAAATGSRSAQARGGGGPSCAVRARAGRPRASRGLGAAPPPTGRRSARRRGRGSPWCASRSERVGRHRVGGRHDRGVGDDPAGRDVAGAGDLVAGLPQLADGGERAPAADPVQPGGTAPRLDARTAGANAAQVRRTPGAPTRPCRPPRARAASTSRSSTSTSTSSAAYSSHGSGSGRVDQSTAECSLRQPVAEQRLDERGQPDPGVAEQPAGELGVEQRRRGAGRPRSGTAGPGWRRAGSTRRRRGPPAAGRR